MKIIDKINELMIRKKYQNSSVFDIADIIVENVPLWIKVDGENLNLKVFGITNFDNTTLTCYGEDDKNDYLITVMLNCKNDLYIHDYVKNNFNKK